MRLFRFCSLWALLSPNVAGAPLTATQELLKEADAANPSWPYPIPLPPSLDPWYRAPFDWDQTDPGDVLKIRLAPLLNLTVGNAMVAYHIMYRSTDSEYNPSWAVTTLFIPWWQYRCTAVSPTLCAHAVLSYQLPYDSANVDASPSYALLAGEPFGEISDTLSLGWFVNVPDYEGPLASYGAGVQAGHATLDSVRAVLDVGGYFGLRLQAAKVALWGYSGGALASEWASELAVQYAPRLQIAGMALGGLTPNITSVANYINGGECAGLLPSALIGITTQHPDAYQWMMSRLKTSGAHSAATFLSAKYLNALQSMALFKGQNIYDYFVGGYSDLHTGVMRVAFDTDGYMGYHGVPKMPVFIYKSVYDQLSSVVDTDDLVARYCKVGANILYHRNFVGGHYMELVNGRPRAFAFLSSILDGTYGQLYQTMGCTIQNVSINLTPLLPWN